MDFILDSDESFSPADRRALIRYCVSVGTRAVCSAPALYRPFKMKYLACALSERKNRQRARIEDYKRRARDYDPAVTRLPAGLIESFGGMPSKEDYARYLNGLIEQEKEALKLTAKCYSVSVDYPFLTERLRAFHESLNPRVTFGDSNRLHEECGFPLDDEKKQAFLSSLQDGSPLGLDVYDWGLVAFRNALVYEDLTVFRGEACVLETVSHENMMTVRLEEEDLAAISAEKSGCALVKKLRRLQP